MNGFNGHSPRGGTAEVRLHLTLDQCRLKRNRGIHGIRETNSAIVLANGNKVLVASEQGTGSRDHRRWTKISARWAQRYYQLLLEVEA
jgi:hypothetical protein